MKKKRKKLKKLFMGYLENRRSTSPLFSGVNVGNNENMSENGNAGFNEPTIADQSQPNDPVSVPASDPNTPTSSGIDDGPVLILPVDPNEPDDGPVLILPVDPNTPTSADIDDGPILILPKDPDDSGPIKDSSDHPLADILPARVWNRIKNILDKIVLVFRPNNQE